MMHKTTFISSPSSVRPLEESGGRGRGRLGILKIITSIDGEGDDVAETAGGSFTPHVMTVNDGENLASKIIEIFPKDHHNGFVCILSAIGAILCKTDYFSIHGDDALRLELLSLSGSSTFRNACHGNDGARDYNPMLSISLVGYDGTAIGGVVEGPLIAAGPVQITMASFKQNNISKEAGSSAAPDMSSNPDLGGDVAETAGGSFIPHLMTLNDGEDVASKIFEFFPKDRRNGFVCILSAIGAVSSVALRKTGYIFIHEDDTLRLEGLFQLLSLSGSSTFCNACYDDDDANDYNPMSSISLADSNGMVFGGVLEGPLIAAGPVQIIMASYKQSNIIKEIRCRHSAGSSAAPNMSRNKDSERFQFSPK